MSETNHAPTGILDALMAAYNRHDPAAAASLYASDGTHEDVADGKVARGARMVQQGLASFLAALPDARWDVRHLLGGTEAAGAVYEMCGTLQRDLGPFAANGQTLCFQGVMVVIVDEGRIARSRDFWDSGTVARQLRAS